MLKWLVLVNSTVMGLNPAQVSDCPTICLVWVGTLVTLYKRNGLLVSE